MTLWGETEHLSGKIGPLYWSILVGKQKHNVQKLSSHPFSRALRQLHVIITSFDWFIVMYMALVIG